MPHRLLPFILLLLCCRAQAQDSLLYVNGSVVLGIIEEIGLKTVRYRTYSGENPVQVTVEKEELARIRLQSGQEFVITALSTARVDERMMARKQCISFDVLAPALNHATIGYERQIGPRTNFQVKLGYIGLMQIDQYSHLFNSQGGLMKIGLKLRLPTSPKRIASGRTLHGLAGWYIRPELTISSWVQHRQFYYIYPNESWEQHIEYTSGAFVVNFGNQWLLGDRITFDLYSGMGYGLQWAHGIQTHQFEYNFSHEQYSFSHSFFGTGTPLVVTGGMMFGFVF